MLLNRRRGFIAIAAIASLLLLADLHSGGYVRGAWNRSLSHPYSSAEEFPGALAERIFNFTWDKPTWLTDPLPAGAPPTRFRVAFISHPAEADRRQAVRELLLADLPADEVIVDHLFFAGTDNNTDHDAALRAEADEMKDVRIVDLFEKKDHLSRKRFDAFLWAADAPGEYDYFVTADVDSFIRFRAFARRLRAARPDLDPRVHRISWGWQLHHWWHWKAGVEDEENPGFDVRYDGEWYRYPSGMMYVLSKALTSALRANSDKLAHRILYACDDVMIGSWIKETSPSTTDSDVPFGNATGALYAKKPKDEAGNEITLETTHIVNDEAGVHDPLEHGWKPYPVDWDTVCAHHLNIAEMRGLRYRPEFESEWMKPGEGEVPEGLTLDQ